MSKSYFTTEYNAFLKELAANNNREWFHENKKRYEKSVKEPFKKFVEDLILRVNKLDPTVKIKPQQAIFRIHRDIRFSKDKTPYKTSNSAIIAKDGRKGMHNPGMYIEVGPEHIRVYGGLYMPDKDLLYAIRKKIANELTQFEKVINDSEFKRVFGGIKGEQNKRIPKEFQKTGEKQPLIYNKSFYYFSELSPDEVLNPALTDVIMEKHKAAEPVRKFLHSVVQ